MTDNAKDEELIALLPWYVNGTLTPSEKTEVEALLSRSESAQSELQALRNVQQQIQEDWQTPAPGELGWKRLQKQLKQEGISAALTDNIVDIEQARSKKQSGWNRFLAAAALLVIALQAGVIWNNQPIDQPVTVLSGDAPAQMIEGEQYQVLIKADANWADVEALLTTLDAEIVSGPTAMGMLTISVADGQPNALQQLNGAAILEHVQAVSNE